MELIERDESGTSSSSFLYLYSAYIAYADPAAYPNLPLLLANWDELGFALLAKEYQLRQHLSHLSAMDMESGLLSAPHINYLIEAMTWEIFDRIFDYAVSMPLLVSHSEMSTLHSIEHDTDSTSKRTINLDTLMTCISYISGMISIGFPLQ
jgi:hypothetical protein